MGKMRTFVVIVSAIVLASLVSIGPTDGDKDCKSSAETGGACPQHRIGSGSSSFWVDCENGLAFGSHLPEFKGHFIFIPQLKDGDDSIGDVATGRQEDAPTTVLIFDPKDFSADPGECRIEVFFAGAGVFQPFSCFSNADCAEGAFCLAPFGCRFSCRFSTCPSNLICNPNINRCVLPKIAIGPADIVETRRATGPTSLVIQVTAHGVLDLLNEFEEPTGKKVMFRANGRVVFEGGSFTPSQNEVRIELQEFTGP